MGMDGGARDAPGCRGSPLRPPKYAFSLRLSCPREVATTDDAGSGAENTVREFSVIETYAAFLLALEDDASVELDDTLTRPLDAVSEAIGFL